MCEKCADPLRALMITVLMLGSLIRFPHSDRAFKLGKMSQLQSPVQLGPTQTPAQHSTAHTAGWPARNNTTTTNCLFYSIPLYSILFDSIGGFHLYFFLFSVIVNVKAQQLLTTSSIAVQRATFFEFSRMH